MKTLVKKMKIIEIKCKKVKKIEIKYKKVKYLTFEEPKAQEEQRNGQGEHQENTKLN